MQSVSSILPRSADDPVAQAAVGVLIIAGAVLILRVGQLDGLSAAQAVASTLARGFSELPAA